MNTTGVENVNYKETIKTDNTSKIHVYLNVNHLKKSTATYNTTINSKQNDKDYLQYIRHLTLKTDKQFEKSKHQIQTNFKILNKKYINQGQLHAGCA